MQAKPERYGTAAHSGGWAGKPAQSSEVSIPSARGVVRRSVPARRSALRRSGPSIGCCDLRLSFCRRLSSEALAEALAEVLSEAPFLPGPSIFSSLMLYPPEATSG